MPPAAGTTLTMMTTSTKHTKEDIEEIFFKQWHPLTEQQKEMLTTNIKIEEFAKNEYIYRELEIPESIKCLIEGKVKICKSGISGRDQILRTIRPSELFAYRAYLAEDDYLTSAIAFERSVVASIPMKFVTRLMNENNAVCMQLIKQLATELGKSDIRTINLTQKHIRGRLAESLLTLKERYGIEPDGYTLSIYLSREELANMSNMTTSNAIRTLSAFAQEKFIIIDGRKIKIINEEELRKISENG